MSTTLTRSARDLQRGDWIALPEWDSSGHSGFHRVFGVSTRDGITSLMLAGWCFEPEHYRHVTIGARRGVRVWTGPGSIVAGVEPPRAAQCESSRHPDTPTPAAWHLSMLALTVLTAITGILFLPTLVNAVLALLWLIYWTGYPSHSPKGSRP